MKRNTRLQVRSGGDETSARSPQIQKTHKNKNAAKSQRRVDGDVDLGTGLPGIKPRRCASSFGTHHIRVPTVPDAEVQVEFLGRLPHRRGRAFSNTSLGCSWLGRYVLL